jgi:subtilase family serine protease
MKKLVPLLLLVPLLIIGGACGPITLSTPGQQPSIISFNVDPSSISAGESSDLSWNVSGATTISIDQGIGSVALTGTRAVAPVTTTIYTLTASNSSGSTTATTQVVVTGTSSSSPSPSPTPTPGGWPIVNYFMANPSVIAAGGSTTLGWDVSNATSIVIDNGVGSVGSAGTTIVSPAASTNYTLTATNATGSYYMTIAVLVTGAAPAGMPDLIIQDIVRSGDSITYTIKNQGDAAAGASTSTLLVDSATVANDSVGSLSPGEAKTETFTGYTYSCTLPSDTLSVKADTGGTVVESSEVNNSYSESWACLLQIQPVVPVFAWKPDLVITDIWIDGHTIRYRIKNEGTGASSIGYSRLYIDGDVKGNDLDVPVIAAGDSLPRSFTYNFDCALPIIKEVKVTADRGGTSTESDETNNSRTENLACP